MKTTFKLTEFAIKKLHGRLDYRLKFKNNRLILVGENGAGKTTILRILYFFLSGQWNNLSSYSFESVSIKINGDHFSVSKTDLSKDYPNHEQDRHTGIPSIIRNRIRRTLSTREFIPHEEVEYLSERYGIPLRTILREIDYQESRTSNISSKKIQTLNSLISPMRILHLPTYRRIERDFSAIFSNSDMEEFLKRKRRQTYYRNNQISTELIEFGMNDVKEAIDIKLEHLKEFTRTKLNNLTLAYLGEVVDKKYTEVDVEKIKTVEDDTVKNILERIEKRILRKNSKQHLVDTIKNVKNNEELDAHQKVICHYFIKLLNFQQELENEEQGIRNFCKICNNYMEDKSLVYISSSFNLSVKKKKHGDTIKLSQLSSGEKQIVSLFSHLYLSENENFFVMIDEPELSLSVPWQRKFLQDISNSKFCSGFIAVTHSPFIYDNKLEKFAYGLGEFIDEASNK